MESPALGPARNVATPVDLIMGYAFSSFLGSSRPIATNSQLGHSVGFE